MTKKLNITTLKTKFSPVGKKAVIIIAAVAGALAIGGLAVVLKTNNSDSEAVDE